MPDGAVEVVSRALDGVAVRQAEGQVCGNRRCERASGSVGVPRVDPRPAYVEGLRRRAGDVDRVGAVEMAALDQYDARPQPQDPPACLPHVGGRSHRHLGEDLGFGHVRRNDVGAREQFGPQGGDCIRFEQPVPAFGDHHRIDHDMRQFERLDRRRHRFDDRGGREHPHLHGIGPDVSRDRLDLRDHEVCRQRLPGDDAQGVLRGDGGDRARAEDAERGKRLQVRLDAGAAARVAPGNGQCCAHAQKSSLAMRKG
jgi:hypothetical protein